MDSPIRVGGAADLPALWHRVAETQPGVQRRTQKGAACAAPSAWDMKRVAYQKNCRRASRMFGSSLTKPRALELYFSLSTIT